MKSEGNIWYAIDYETSDTNKHSCEVAGLGICEFNIETGKILDSRYDNNYLMLVTRKDAPLVMHNASFDIHLLQRGGFKVDCPIHDTLLMAKHINNLMPFFDLKSLAWHYFGEPYLELLELKKWFRSQGLSDDETYMDLTLPPVKLVAAYCLKDVEMTAKLAHIFWKDLKDNFAYELDRKTVPCTVDMEARGIAVDLKFCNEYKRKGARRAKYNRKVAAERMGTEKNPMGDALRDHLAELGETRTTATGKTQADDVVLRDWKGKDKVMGSVGRVREVEKHISTYINNMLAASVPLEANENIGVFHPNFMQSGAVTRRYKCKGFYGSNGVKTKGSTHNFPADMREAVIARPGFELWKFDLGSIEARMFSAFLEMLMGDSTFAEMYRKDPNFNPYLWVVEQCTGRGKVTKKDKLYVPYKHGVLGRLYCSGPDRFASVLRDKFNLLDFTVDECKDIYRSIDKHCPFIKAFQRFLLNLAEAQGYLMDPFGAIYYRPDHKPYEIIAHLHQGAATMVLRWWWIRVHKAAQKVGDYPVNNLHDEFDCEIWKKNKPASRAKGYCKIIEKLDLFGLPLRAEASRGKNWKECG